MIYRADFLDGDIKFEALPAYLPCPKDKQLAMFVDRPDLWKLKGRKPKKHPKEQLRLEETQ